MFFRAATTLRLLDVIWPADILHFYGFYILIALLAVEYSTSVLWLLITGTTILFPILLVIIPYDTSWDWSSLSYIDFWSFSGFIRNTFYNGFHPVFPWIAFLFLGIIFGRINFTRKLLVKYFIISTII